MKRMERSRKNQPCMHQREWSIYKQRAYASLNDQDLILNPQPCVFSRIAYEGCNDVWKERKFNLSYYDRFEVIDG